MPFGDSRSSAIELGRSLSWSSAAWMDASPRALGHGMPLGPERLRWGSELEWFRAPFTGIPGVSRLLPSQTLEIAKGEVSQRSLLPALDRAASYAELIERIESRLRKTVRELAGRYHDLWLPLTAGIDSRLLLAVCAAEAIRVQAFTFERPEGHRSHRPADLALPPKLAAAVGYEHRLIALGSADEEARALWDRHTALHSDDLDRDLVYRRQWAQVPSDALILGGSVFETGRLFYQLSQPAVPGAYTEWVRRHPSELDWRDRVYLEQRVGGWLASFEQGFDSTGRARIHAANDSTLLSLLLSIPEEIRAYGLHQRELIRRLAPDLAAWPINPVDFRTRLSRRMNRERALYRHHGGTRPYLRHRLGRLRTGSQRH